MRNDTMTERQTWEMELRDGLALLKVWGLTQDSMDWDCSDWVQSKTLGMVKSLVLRLK